MTIMLEGVVQRTYAPGDEPVRIDNTHRPVPASGPLSRSRNSLHYGVPTMPGANEATVRVAVEYANYCRSTVYAVGANNAPFAIPIVNNVINPDEHRNHLEIRIEIKLVSNDAIWETYEMFRTFIVNNVPLDVDAMGLWESLQSFYRDDARTVNRRNFTYCFVYRILEDQLRQSDLYLFRPNGMQFAFQREAVAKPHPYSDLGFRVEEHKVPERRDQAGMLVTVVDNLRLATVRYYYAGKHVIAVPSQIDRTRKDGVYVTIANGANFGVVESNVYHYTFEEAKEKLGLYLSRQEAETHGNPELVLKTKVVEKTQELEDKKHEQQVKQIEAKNAQTEVQAELESVKTANLRLKEAIEMQRAIRDEQYAHLKNDLDQERAYREEILNRERALRDDYYDQRDLKRKDKFDKKATKRKSWIDSLKFGQLAAGALIGLVGLMFGKKMSAA